MMRTVLLCWVAATLTLTYWQTVEAPRTDDRIAHHDAILAGTTTAPERYRVLAPLVTEAAMRPLRPVIGERRAFQGAYLLWNLLWTGALLVWARKLFARYTDDGWALVGALALVPPLLLSFGNPHFFFMPWSVAEPALMVAGLLAAATGRTYMVALLVLVATLNRETGLFLAVAAAAASSIEARGAGRFRAAWPIALWAAVYAGVRAVQGGAPHSVGLTEAFRLNTSGIALLWAGMFLVALLGPFWAAAVRGWSRAEPVIRRSAWAVPVAVALYAAFAIWTDVRVLLPVVPILLLVALTGRSEDEARERVFPVLVCGWVAAVLVFLYWQFAEAPHYAERVALHADMLSGAAVEPRRFRLLGPWVAEGLRALFAGVLGGRAAFHLAYLTWNLAGAWGLLAGTYLAARRWFGRSWSLAAALLLAPSLLVAFANANYYYEAWSIGEMGLTALGLAALAHGRRGWALLAVALTSLSKETGLFLALASAAATPRPGPGTARTALRAAIPLAIWAAVYGGARLVVGPGPAWYTLAEIFELNRPSAALVWAGVNLAFFLGPLAGAAALGFRRSDPMLRRMAPAMLPMLGLFVVFAVWREVRVLLALLPLIVLLGVRAWAPPGPEASLTPRSAPR